MHRILSTRKAKSLVRCAGLVTAAGALALGFTSCKNESEAAPDRGLDYYPVAVGNYWTYAVVDTTWSQATPGVPSVATPSTYQFKETITEKFTDAAGQPAYRMVRSKLVAPATTFRADSVFVVSATEQFVAVNRNNTRTVELIFPPKEGKSWNFNAFNNNFNDTISAETRKFSRIGQPFATGGTAPKTYPTTLVTTNSGAATENNLLKRLNYQQVFAKGVGPVYRRRDYFVNYYFTEQNGNVRYVPGSYFSAVSRRETLIDYGPR